MNGPDDAKVVNDLGGVRQKLADPCAAVAMPSELILRGGDRFGLLFRRKRGQPLPLAHRIGQLGLVKPLKTRLVVEQVQLGGAAGLEQKDYPFRGWCNTWQLLGRASGLSANQQVCGDRSERDARMREESAAGKISERVLSRIQHLTPV